MSETKTIPEFLPTDMDYIIAVIVIDDNIESSYNYIRINMTEDGEKPSDDDDDGGFLPTIPLTISLVALLFIVKLYHQKH